MYVCPAQPGLRSRRVFIDYFIMVHASVYFVTHENKNSLEIGVIDTRFSRCPEYISTLDRAWSHIAIGWKITA